jgi:hypothetical protein
MPAASAAITPMLLPCVMSSWFCIAMMFTVPRCPTLSPVPVMLLCDGMEYGALRCRLISPPARLDHHKARIKQAAMSAKTRFQSVGDRRLSRL